MFDILVWVTEVPRRAARHPRSLTEEQLTHSSISTAGEPLRVSAWVIWEDGVEELVVGHAVAGPLGPSRSGSASRPTSTKPGSGLAPSPGSEYADEQIAATRADTNGLPTFVPER